MKDSDTGFDGLRAAGVKLLWRPIQGEISSPFREEREQVAAAIDKRQQEYFHSRQLARELMQQLGYKPQAIPTGADRAPLWPEGLIGSLSHNDRYCAAALAPKNTATGLGLDIETCGRIGRPLWRNLFTDTEQAWLETLPESAQHNETTALFSIKEAFCKYQHPQTHQWVGFRDVEVERLSEQRYQLTARHEKAYLAAQCVAETHSFDDCVISVVVPKNIFEGL